MAALWYCSGILTFNIAINDLLSVPVAVTVKPNQLRQVISNAESEEMCSLLPQLQDRGISVRVSPVY